MFTGIVSAVGRIAAVQMPASAEDRGAGGRILRIVSPYPDLVDGESIAVDGACLTVCRVDAGAFEVQVVATSLDRTRFAASKPGDVVNLERAVRAEDRLGGHLLQGHVDGMGTVQSVTDRGDARVVVLDVPPAVAEVTVPLGSLGVDGVSMTVVAIPAPGTVELSLIPYTLEHTTLGRLVPGSPVHLEADVIGKYVARLLDPYRRALDGAQAQ